MSSVPKLDLGLEQAKIAAVRQEWVQAVRDGNAYRLGDLTSDDVVAVLKDGGCVNGKEAVVNTGRKSLNLCYWRYTIEPKLCQKSVFDD